MQRCEECYLNNTQSGLFVSVTGILFIVYRNLTGSYIRGMKLFLHPKGSLTQKVCEPLSSKSNQKCYWKCVVTLKTNSNAWWMTKLNYVPTGTLITTSEKMEASTSVLVGAFIKNSLGRKWQKHVRPKIMTEIPFEWYFPYSSTKICM